MNTLVIDTTTNNMVVLVIKEDCTVIDGTLYNVGTKHSETLCTQVQLTLKRADLTFADIDCYAVGIGPGSFTGIRIGVSTVKGYNTVCKKKLIAINNLQLLCVSNDNSGDCSAVINAGNGWYYAGYNGINCICQPQLISYDDQRVDSAVQFDKDKCYTDSYVQYVKLMADNNCFVDNIQPLYIRKSQAELNKGV